MKGNDTITGTDGGRGSREPPTLGTACTPLEFSEFFHLGLITFDKDWSTLRGVWR